MKKVLFLLVFVLLYIVQTSMGASIKIFGITPDFILVFTIVYALDASTFASAILGCVCGLLMDISGKGAIGYNGLIIMYIAFCVSVIANKFYFENMVVVLLVVFSACFVTELINVLVSNLLLGSPPFWYVLWRYILPGSIINTIIAYPIFYMIKWLNNKYIRGL